MHYKTIQLRSQVERAWAKQFDKAGLLWKYEIVTFGSREKYTPDFYLLHYDLFIEIKSYGSRRLNHFHVCTWPLLIIFGMPNRHYTHFKPRGATRVVPGHSIDAIAFITTQGTRV